MKHRCLKAVCFFLFCLRGRRCSVLVGGPYENIFGEIHCGVGAGKALVLSGVSFDLIATLVKIYKNK